jgi:UMP-CMP kinase
MMQGSSFRRVSAFATRLFSSPPRRGSAFPPAFATRGGSSSVAPAPANIVEESMNIFDPSAITPKVFAGIPYWDTSQTNQFRVFFVLGGPGAGKGTQCELLLDNFPCVHFSVGELLRNVPPDSPHAQLIEETLVAGNIVPVEISLSLLKAAMEQQRGKSLYYLVDGFPRNYDNLEGWCRNMEDAASVWGVFMFQCPFEELERRILSRAETSGRSDDNIASAKRRFATFERETVPVVNVLREVERNTKSKLSLRVMDIRGDKPLEEVWDDTQCLMNQFILHDVVTANAQLLQAVQEGNGELYRSLVAWQDDDNEEEEQDATKFMTSHEGPPSEVKVSNGLIDFVEGKKVVVSYDRVLADQESIREFRVWSHEGERGWVNIHFSRTPL